MFGLHVLQPGSDVATAVHVVEFVGDQQRRDVLAQERQHPCISRGEAARLHHKQNQVHIGHGANHGFVQRLVEGVAMNGLETGGIHKHKLRCTHGVHTSDAVAGGLRLARGDADLLPHQRVEQGGFADVGFTHNGDQATALARYRRFHRPGRTHVAVKACQHGFYIICACSPRGICLSSYIFSSCHGSPLTFSVCSMVVAAACSPARREPPVPRAVRLSSVISHSTSKVCLCAAPSVATTL